MHASPTRYLSTPDLPQHYVCLDITTRLKCMPKLNLLPTICLDISQGTFPPPIRVTNLLHPMLRARPSGFPLAPEIVTRPVNGTLFVLVG